mgnify:CR=1 FL=1
MNKANLISVIVPVYNVENYVEQCIKSIFNQTYKKFELIIVIDGSTDSSEKIIRNLVKNENNVKIISRENKGLLATRIEAVEKYAMGDYITFVDSDDWLEKDALENLIKPIKENQTIDIVRANKINVDENENKTFCQYIGNKNIINKDEFKNIIYPKFVDGYEMNNVYAQLIKKDLFKEIDIDRTISLGEDLVTNIYLYRKANKVCFINNYVYNYRFNSNSITKIIKKEKLLKNLVDIKKSYGYLINFIEIENMSSLNQKSGYKLLKELNHSILRLLYIEDFDKKSYKNILKSEFEDNIVIHARNIINEKYKTKVLQDKTVNLIYKNEVKLYYYIAIYLMKPLIKFKKFRR